MALRIEQEAELVKTIQPRDATSPLGWWRWRVWIEGNDEELEPIEWVRYQLHPTFPEPTQIVKDRHSKFALQGSGWGEFTIYAAAHLANGSELSFKHWLRLAGQSQGSMTPTAHTLAGEPPKLFLAYAFADSHLAEAVGEALRASHVQVIDPNTNVGARDKWRDFYSSALDAYSSALDAADVAAVFISEGAEPWLQNEVSRIQEKGIDLLPVVVRGTKAPEVPGNLLQYQPLEVESGEDPTEIANRILQEMPALRAHSQTG